MPWYFVPFLGELVWFLICELCVVVHVATRDVMHVADGRQGAAAGLVGPGPDAMSFYRDLVRARQNGRPCYLLALCIDPTNKKLDTN